MYTLGYLLKGIILNIFKDNCLKYLKEGYSVIPDSGKKPLIKKWNDYCKKQPTLDEVKSWCSKFPNANIAICLGEQSGVIALDFDEIDPEIVKIIEPLLPQSPVERIGSKGFVRFFQYSGEISQNVYLPETESSKKRIVLELLSSGKKVTIAPSIHPVTNKPYVWTKKELLEINKKELPKFPPMLITNLQSKLQFLSVSLYNTNKNSTTESRNISLSSFLGKALNKPHTINGMIEDLIEYDKNNHKKPLFNDVDDQEFKDPRLNALFFYTNHLRTRNKDNTNKNKDLNIPILGNDFSIINKLIQKDNIDKVNLPKPTGLLKYVYDYILDYSYIEQPMFALSASIALLGTLASRKFVFQNTTPNLFLLNIADSGSGKNACQEIVKELLFTIKAANKLLGASKYPSEASIIKDIDVKPVRLDIIDECSTFLKSASRGGADYSNGMGDTLCELYSCANSFYAGKSLASSKINVGSVYRPHINILGSTTYRGINESMSMSSLEKGLFARFLVFFGDNNKEGKRVLKTVNPPEDMLNLLTYWYRFINPAVKNKGNLVEFNIPAYRIPCTRSANDLLTKYHRLFDNRRLECKSDSYQRPIIARLYQHMLKITMISAISNTEINKFPIVKPIDVDFAYQLIEYYFQNIIGFVKDNLFESVRGMKVKKVLGFIKAAGEEGLSNVELSQKSDFLNTHERIDIIKDLKESDRILIEPTEGNSFKFIYKGV